jgi:alkane 1-monooxygenase
MARCALGSVAPAAHNPGMTTATSTPPPTSAFRDRKRLGWLLSVVGPGLAAIGTLAHSLGATSLWWFALPLVLFYLVVPIADLLIGEDLTNPPESEVPALEADGYYRGILYAAVPVLWATVLFNLVFLATNPLPWPAWLGTVLVTGSVLGFGLNLSHELGHKQDWLARKLSLFNSALGGYGHFSIEHNRGHHRHVSTPEDPASSRLGESIYRFVLREMPGAFRRAWALETDRLQRRGMRAWHPDNEILQAGALTLVLYGSLIALYGWPMVAPLPLVAFWGAFQLTSANYIEHYGLQRRRLADGRYERCAPHHSWNSNHLVSNLIVFQLQRHSDHHAHPGRSYQSLRDFPDLPRLPSGYFGMFLLAYLPPLWFRVMDPRVAQAVHGDAARINFQPGLREPLMRKLGLATA